MEWLSKYYGIDWIGMICTAISLWYLGKHRKFGFVIGTVGDCAWLVFGFIVHSPANIVATVIYILFNIKAWHQWKEEMKRQGHYVVK
jgi:hypothetical protein